MAAAGRQPATPLVAVALAAAAATLGLVAGISPAYAVAGALGLGFVAVVLQSVTLGLCLMAFVAFLDTLPTVGALSVAKITGVLLAVSWLAAIATRREAQLPARHPAITWALLLFLAWSALSLVWAEDDGEAINALVRYAPNALLIPIAYTAVRHDRHLAWVFWAIAIAAFLAAALGVAAPPADPSIASGDPARATGTVGDANELAAGLLVGLVLALVLALDRGLSGPVRLVLAGGAGLCMLGILLSLSRGGLLALGMATLVAVVVAGRWRGRAIVVAALLVVSAVVYFGAFASLPARERVLDVGGGGTGRVDLWTVGLRMVADRPLEGVGVGNFQVASIHYLLQPGAIERDDFIITTPKVAHNTFLQVMAETGMPGLLLFSFIVVACLACAVAAIRRFTAQRNVRMEILCRGLVVAIAGYLTAGFFISANYNKVLWLLLGLGPAALGVARRAESSSS